MKPAWSRRSTSSLIARLLSLFILLSFCFTGLASVLMESLWQMIAGSNPGMSVGVHANTSEFSDKNCLNSVFPWGRRFEPIRSTRTWTMWVYTEWLGLLLGLIVRVFWLGVWVRISTFACCHCFWSVIFFCFLSTGESSLGPTWEAFCKIPG